MEQTLNEPIPEFEKDYEIVYKDYVDISDNFVIKPCSIIVEPPICEIMERCEESDNEDFDKIQEPFFSNTEMEIIRASSLFGLFFFSLYIIMNV